MEVIKKTVSFCPECYQRVLADIAIKNDNVVMVKTCPEHGMTEALIEKDAAFYIQGMHSMAPFIYQGYFLDVTERCNLKCKYCYFGVNNKSEDRSIDSILSEATIHAHMAPIILTGGEPTLRKDIIEIVKGIKNVARSIEMVTNGYGLTKELVEELFPLMSSHKTACINLSMHKESNGKDIEAIELFRSMGIRLESILFVIDDLNDIDGVISFCEANSDVIDSVRLKLATRIWSERKEVPELFCSDMVSRLKQHGAVPVWWRQNKARFFNMQIDKVIYMLCCWYDVYNVDILDISCPPFYKAKSGTIENIVTSNIVNEGIAKGWLDGRRIKE